MTISYNTFTGIADHLFGTIDAYGVNEYFEVGICIDIYDDLIDTQIRDVNDLYGYEDDILNSKYVWLYLSVSTNLLSEHNVIDSYDTVNIYASIAGVIEEAYSDGAFDEYSIE